MHMRCLCTALVGFEMVSASACASRHPNQYAIPDASASRYYLLVYHLAYNTSCPPAHACMGDWSTHVQSSAPCLC
ncbi:hypothetical protein BV20DRAFT_972452 [Pilatotrama ljubarskyi]|nr:hypothetical protein BV20DRAFT_972452 [Pilatotrama ljubarskyi]